MVDNDHFKYFFFLNMLCFLDVKMKFFILRKISCVMSSNIFLLSFFVHVLRPCRKEMGVEKWRRSHAHFTR